MPERLGSDEVIRVLREHGFFLRLSEAATRNTRTQLAGLSLCLTHEKNCPLARHVPSSGNRG